MSNWCTIESDPGVFTELISSLGVKDVQVEELWDLEQASLDRVKPVYGLIFLFKWVADAQPPVYATNADDVYFAKQVVNNACATQALLSVLLNRPEIELGASLQQFKEFTSLLPADLRGEEIGNHDLLREVHNSFARPEPFIFEEKKQKTGEDDDAFHFISYVPVNGQVYELDGLKRGPIALGECTLDNWLNVAREAIQKRVQTYTAKEIRFNLLAMVQKRSTVLNQNLNKVRHEISEATAASAADRLNYLQVQESDILAELKEEENKYEKWRVENIRRRHNYVPFIFNLLKSLATQGKLEGLVEDAIKQASTRAANARQKQQQEKEKEKEKETSTSSQK